MLLSSDVHPTNDIYYVGSQLLALLDRFETLEWEIIDLYQESKSAYALSYGLFSLAIEWLYLLGALDLCKEGRLHRCG
jgi:pantothenate kinase